MVAPFTLNVDSKIALVPTLSCEATNKSSSIVKSSPTCNDDKRDVCLVTVKVLA